MSAHSDIFNQSVTAVLTSYYALSGAFVNWDSTAVNKAASDLQAAIGEFKVEELKKTPVFTKRLYSRWITVKIVYRRSNKAAPGKRKEGLCRIFLKTCICC
ncbi:DUF3347 domain-containing protein [Niabella hibiscisoli]|uniref:DUF3347 domain-containing protein n=1 Tax=Niabella hibiscisoli TaxID=1825928 RepID=UPI001F0EE098|nr:DUF3347 domain-containing protein [Niabella hibiscisoli]MCH5717680.1 DUF3347 domain-containing protein [Niabella hibiscisoli]